MILNACVNVRTLLTIRYEKEDNSAILKAEKEFLKSDDVKRSLIYQSSLMIQTLTSPLVSNAGIKIYERSVRRLRQSLPEKPEHQSSTSLALKRGEKNGY